MINGFDFIRKIEGSVIYEQVGRYAELKSNECAVIHLGQL